MREVQKIQTSANSDSVAIRAAVATALSPLSQQSRRVYGPRLESFVAWLLAAQKPLTRLTVQEYLGNLDTFETFDKEEQHK